MTPELLRALARALPGDLIPEPELSGSAWSRHPDGEFLFHPWASVGDLERDCSVWWPIELLNRHEWEVYLDRLSVRLIVAEAPEAFDGAWGSAVASDAPPASQSVEQHLERLLRALGKELEAPVRRRVTAVSQPPAAVRQLFRVGEADA